MAVALPYHRLALKVKSKKGVQNLTLRIPERRRWQDVSSDQVAGLVLGFTPYDIKPYRSFPSGFFPTLLKIKSRVGRSPTVRAGG